MNEVLPSTSSTAWILCMGIHITWRYNFSRAEQLPGRRLGSSLNDLFRHRFLQTSKESLNSRRVKSPPRSVNCWELVSHTSISMTKERADETRLVGAHWISLAMVLKRRCMSDARFPSLIICKIRSNSVTAVSSPSESGWPSSLGTSNQVIFDSYQRIRHIHF